MSNRKKMKITAIIDDQMVREAVKYSEAKTITEAVKIALREYIDKKKLKALHEGIKNKPLRFTYSAQEIRNLNRQ